MGYSLRYTGSFAAGFRTGTFLAIAALTVLSLVIREWTGQWIAAGGKAIAAPSLVVPTDAAVPVTPVAQPVEA